MPLSVYDVAKSLNAEVIVSSDAGVSSVYAGDFLSRVMGKAPQNSCWLTVMANVNVAGVAVLADIKIVVLCEGVIPDPLLVQKCAAENIALLSTGLGVYESCKRL